MILLPESLTEYVLNLRWANEVRLWIVEEVACGVQTSGTGARGMKEAWERMLRAMERGDRKAEDAAFVDYTRAEVWNWWQSFPARRLLTELYRRDARRQEGSGSPDQRRRPSHQEGLRVARPILADVADPGQFDVEWESAAMSTVLAALYLPPFGVRSRSALRKYITRSGSSRVYFDALGRIEAKLQEWGESIRRPLARWRAAVASGLRRRPARKPVASHRPVETASIPRDIHVQFVIDLLRRVGVKPTGSDVSGCRIVADVLGLSEDTVRRIWKARVQKGPFVPAMQKKMKATAERTGPSIPRRPEPRAG